MVIKILHKYLLQWARVQLSHRWLPQLSQGIIVIPIFSLNGAIVLMASKSLIKKMRRHQALPEADRSPLKATLAQDALVHPDHPLHREGVEGAELYLGN